MQNVLAIANITFWEGLRSRSIFGIAFVALFVFGLNIAVAGFFMRDVGKVTVDMNLAALSFSGLLIVLFVGLNLIAKDIDKKTVQLVLSKPISRQSYIVGKYLGILCFVFVSLLFLVLISSFTIASLKVVYADYFGSYRWSPFIVACCFVFMKLSVVTAIVLFFSSMTTNSFITLILSVAVFIVGETIEDVIFYLNTTFAQKDLVLSDSFRSVIEFVSYLVPNFSVFDYKVEAAYGLTVDVGRVLLSLGYGVLYVILLLFFASLSFSRREFN